MLTVETKNAQAKRPRFLLGAVVMTRGAASSLSQQDIDMALHRHQRGDWGIVSEPDRQQNDESLRNGYRVLSVFESWKGSRFWVVTEWEWPRTTILLPEEY